MGFGTVLLMVVLMLASLSMYKGTPAAQRAKLSNQLRERFNFPEAAAAVRDEHGDLVLRVEYVSSTDSGYRDEVMTEELGRVADFTRLNYDGKDRKYIRRLSVRRTELREAGCWSKNVERELHVDHPFLKKETITPDDAPPPEDEEK